MDRGLSAAQRLEEFRRSLGEDADGLGELPEIGGEFHGRSRDGLVDVTVADGRVVAVTATLTPADHAATELGDHLMTAANNALAAARAAVPVVADPVPDLDALMSRLSEAGEQSSRFMRQVGTALEEVIAKVGPRTGMHGDPAPTGVDALFADAASALRTARDSLAGLAGPQITTSGSDEDHEVWVTIGVDGTVTKVEFSSPVASMTGRQFADRSRQALGAALGEWITKRREQQAPAAGLDPAGLTAQADALRRQSVAQLQEYTGKLKSIMGSIGEP
ncbi:hypothetical protein [Lentzea sp. NPDC004782]|uniref:hypothetical protein n=1 Tax=Lentzea sp. NPDC004782 TaxID=3154458 RepID=UPI0033AE02AD